MRKRWTEDELKILTEFFPHHSTRMVANRLGRTYSSVSGKALLLGLKKSDDYMLMLKEAHSQRMRIQGNTGQFKKGQKPWNTGMKGIQIGGVETQFKKGQKPLTMKPVGSRRRDKEGHLIEKQSSGEWIRLSVLLWEKHHRPVPEKHVVRMVNGIVDDLRIENIECISMAENMRRNTIHRYPSEVVSAIKLTANLMKQIERQTK